MTSELKPCPFCGGKATDAHLTGSAWFIATDCDEDCHLADFQRSEAKAITAWNTRAKAEQIMGVEGEELSALRKFFDALTDRFWIEQWMEIDGSDFQDIAEWAGLIRPEPYDPEKHAYSDDASPGDPWFVRVFPKGPTRD